MENLEIRLLVSEAGLHYRDIAKTMGISPIYLSRILRKPLSDYHRKKILEAVNKMMGEDWSGDDYAEGLF